MNLGSILGMARERIGRDGSVVHLGLAVVLGEDREGWVCGRGGRVDEVGGEVEGLTGVCATGVNDEMGAVTKKKKTSERGGQRQRQRRMRGGATEGDDPARCGAGAAAELVVRAWCALGEGAKRGKSGQATSPCRVLVSHRNAG